MFWCDFLPLPTCAGWTMFMSSSVQFLPHQLDGVQSWRLKWPSHRIEFLEEFLHNQEECKITFSSISCCPEGMLCLFSMEWYPGTCFLCFSIHCSHFSVKIQLFLARCEYCVYIFISQISNLLCKINDLPQ